MNLELYFKNINKGPNDIDPMIKIIINGQEEYNGTVQKKIAINKEINNENVKLEINFYNKIYKDTKVDDVGKIINDMNFEISKIIVDTIDFEDLIWNSTYVFKDQTIEKCLFFGPNGKFIINWKMPVLKWYLETQHQLKNNDPNWEEDYEYYIEGCKILKQI
tara:strand:+ start:1334 stop:1819 length:486 start_codon:yes stop_codon:yes gene_type:complete